MATKVRPAPEALAEEKPLRFRPRPPRVPVVPRRPAWLRGSKVVADFVLALVIAVPALPIIALCALLVRLTSRGPAFYSQTRVGLGGRLFTIWKIRTMTQDAEAVSGAKWCVPGDPRVTALGWFLRKTHL
ncbi:MAG: sugar transferase, partial [Gemmataceae bacterium]|nr:sugar transferase [Gemmataceae bacterium]